MALLHYLWSRTAASNSTADSAVNWAEGQAPSSVNDSARAMMASLAGYRDDIAGAITTGGTSTAYTVTSYQVFDTLAHMNGQIVAFTPHATNGATVTLNVDGLGAKPLRSAPSTELPSGVLVQGTPYVALYNSSDAVFYLRNFYVNPYVIPVGSCLPYFGTTAPNSSFVFPYGQAISRTTYSSLFTLFSTTFGTGDGSTTFNVPDIRGRVIGGKDDMGGAAAGYLTATYFGAADGALGTTLGAKGGIQASTIVTANLPAYTPAGTISNGAITVSGGSVGRQVAGDNNNNGGGGGSFSAMASTALSLSASQASSTFAGTAQGGSSTPYSNVQPTIIGNYILRVI